jgi:hypothetical protein
MYYINESLLDKHVIGLSNFVFVICGTQYTKKRPCDDRSVFGGCSHCISIPKNSSNTGFVGESVPADTIRGVL